MKYLFFACDKKNTQQENMIKTITIHNPLVDGPSKRDLLKIDAIASENNKENCWMDNQAIGIVCTRI